MEKEKRIPYSHSTFPSVHVKAGIKAKREGTTVSTKIHEYLQEYTKGEPDPVEQMPAVSATDTGAAAVGSQPENTTASAPEAIQPENSNGGESLEPPLTPETETTQVDTEPIVQPENNAGGETVEAVDPENNTAVHEPVAEGETVPPARKKPASAKPAKKASNATVKKMPPKKELKKVTPKPGVAAKKKDQAAKSKKSKAKS